jgi:hypothetical protein
MSKITLLAAAAAVLILIGIDAWLSVKTLGPTDQFAGPIISPLYMTTSAKGPPPSSHRDSWSEDHYRLGIPGSLAIFAPRSRVSSVAADLALAHPRNRRERSPVRCDRGQQNRRLVPRLTTAVGRGGIGLAIIFCSWPPGTKPAPVPLP